MDPDIVDHSTISRLPQFDDRPTTGAGNGVGEVVQRLACAADLRSSAAPLQLGGLVQPADHDLAGDAVRQRVPVDLVVINDSAWATPMPEFN
jgi:hypothetical protein